MINSSTKIPNFLTFDVEEWYHANYNGVQFSYYTDQQTPLEYPIDQFIALCTKYHINSTCFVLGSVAENNPHIVKKLYRAGHEIASHGYGHKLVYTMSPKEFKEDVKKSCEILENIIEENILGFRAPSWSIHKNNLDWYYSILEELGFKYSSSVYPGKTFLYGIPDFSPDIHYPVVNESPVNILEIPVPIISVMGKKIGFSGGFYLRFFPRWFIQYMLKEHNKAGKSVCMYFHPREIDIHQPRLQLPFLETCIHYWGLKGHQKKLEKIIQNFLKSFTRIKDIISYPGRK